MSWRCADALDQFIAEARELVPGGRVDTIGDAAHSSRESDHNPCDCHAAVCAGDVFTYQYDCAALAENLRRLALKPDYRVKYVIYDRRIFSGPGQSYPNGQWRSYTGSNPHTDHLHLSIQHPSSQFDRTDRWDVFRTPTAAPADPLEEVMSWYANRGDYENMIVEKCNLAVRQVLASGEGHDRIMVACRHALDERDTGPWPGVALTAEDIAQAVAAELDTNSA